MTFSNFEIRPATSEEMPAFQALAKYAFAENSAPDAAEEAEPLLPEWSLAAFDGNKVVASSGGLPFKMRFNGHVVAADGVTAVATDPGYRRQGAVRALITGLMHRARDNGVPVSILWASMGAIYQRFGYGLASTMVDYTIEPRYIQFQFGEPASGYVRLLEKDESLPHCKTIYRTYCNDRTLLLHRASVLWDIMFRRSQAQNVNAAVYFDAQNSPKAYALYQAKWDDSLGSSDGQIIGVSDFAWCDIDGYRGIWEYLASHDLASKIRWKRAPEDDPAPNMLLEPRRLHRQTGDAIWLRVNDVETALGARGYDLPGEVVLRINEDDICPWNVGTYRMTTTGEATDVERISDDNTPIDCDISINGLASLLAGHTSLSQLHRIGRASVTEEARLPAIDALFSTRYRPLCSNMF
ncbi:MAG: GNAT family N-acetyltransferase [Gammaproteobacteria bacterium]|nr:GNAT family N-acetyltransferase [Gammaproteobacteria bacterium]